MNPVGYIKLHRKIKNDWKWSSPHYGFAWMNMLLDAKFAEDNGLSRGQLLTSVRAAAKQWGMSKTHAYRFLEKCVKDRDIDMLIVDRRSLCPGGTKEGTKEGTLGGTLGRFTSVLITILKYDDYQGAFDSTNNGEGTKEGTKLVCTPGTSSKNKKRSTKKEEEEGLSPRLAQIENAKKFAEDQLDSVDLTKFQEKYPWLDIPKELEACKTHHLAIQSHYYGKDRFTDWNRVLHKWCSADWKKDKAIQAGWQPIVKAKPPEKETKDEYLEKLQADLQKQSPTAKTVIDAEAQNILPKNLNRAVSSNGKAAEEMLELCKIAVYCNFYDQPIPEACKGVKL